MDKTRQRLRDALILACTALPDGAPETLALLDRLAHTRDPNAIVAALPFICRSSDSRASAAASTLPVLRRLLGRLGVPIASQHDQGDIRAAAQAAVVSLVSGMRPQTLPRLDAVIGSLGTEVWLIRGGGQWLWAAPPRPDEIEDGPARITLVGLLASHANGYRRETAVTALAASADVTALPFLLWRCVDWVAPVRRRAQAAVRAQLRFDHAPAFARMLPLVRRLEMIKRVDASTLVRDIRGLLLREPGQASLMASLRSHEAFVGREACRVLDAAGIPRPEVVDLALANRDVITRTWVVAWEARLRPSDPQGAATLRVRLAADSSPRIRGPALRAMAELHDAGANEHLRAAVLDNAGSVRQLARFYLGKLFPTTDFAAGYRAALGGPRRAASVAGLGETGGPADWQLVLPLLRGTSREARAALRAAKRLNADASHDMRLAALADRRDGVCREAVWLLDLRLSEQDAARLEQLWRDASTPTARRAIAEAVLRLPPWPALLALLHCAQTDLPAPNDAARAALARWRPEDRAHYAPLPPPPGLRDRIEAALRDSTAALPEDRAARIHDVLTSPAATPSASSI